MRQRTKSRVISFLMCIMLLFGGLGIGISAFSKPYVVNAATSTRMSLQTQELVYNSAPELLCRTLNADSYTVDDPNVGTMGRVLSTGKKIPTVANVLHCPDDATSKDFYSVVFNANPVWRMYEGLSKARYRLVLNNEVVFPTDGDWVDLGDTVGVDHPLTATVNMKAGDDLYFVVDDPAAAASGVGVYFVFGCHIDGVFFDCDMVNHIDNAKDSTMASQPFFGGSYTYSQLFTYEAVLSWMDFPKFDNLQKWSAGSEVTFTKGNAETKTPHTANTVDMRGAEYYTFSVDNSIRADDLAFGIVSYERDPNTDRTGCEWTFAEGMEYYLLESGNGAVQILEAGSYDKTNRGIITVPAGFSGQVILPLENFEIYSWLLSSNNTHADRISKFSNARIMDLQYANKADLYLFTPISEPVTVTNLLWLGSDLVTGWLTDDHTTAIKAIDDIGTVTVASESQIVKAKTLYNKLSNEEKAKVTNYATLKAAEKAFLAVSDYSAIVGTDGKDFTGSEGVTVESITSSPSTISAWIKVGRNVEKKTHVGTVVGNMSRVVESGQEKDANETFSMEITANGNPRFVWRKSVTDKATFTVYNVDVRTGNWLNLAFVRNQATGILYCYVNGEMVARKQVNRENLADITITNNYLMIGSDYTSAQSEADFAPDFKGSIAGVRVYTTALSATQMKDNLTSSVADAGLVSDISFRSGAGDYYYDKAVETGETTGTGEYTLTINDTDGKLVKNILMDETAEYALPVLDRPGYVFVGYMVDNNLVPANTTIAVNENREVVAHFVEFAMFNGASIRVSAPTGVRFSTQIDQDQLAAIKAGGATVSFGTLIAMASDITVAESLDYTLLTKGCTIQHLDVVSTVQVENVGRFLQFNGAVVGIKTTNQTKQFAGRGYMTITYSNRETRIFYANVTNNARSVAEVAELALADTRALQTNQYMYLINGAYCCFDEDQVALLKAFIEQ